jgi:hypothetical protein
MFVNHFHNKTVRIQPPLRWGSSAGRAVRNYPLFFLTLFLGIDSFSVHGLSFELLKDEQKGVYERCLTI